MRINFKGIKCSSRFLSGNRDQELILKLQNGDVDSFAPIYARFRKPILKFVLKQVRTVDVAEELTQDIFLKLYQHRKSYNPAYEFSTWLWTIARNTVFDFLRQTQSNISITDQQLQKDREHLTPTPAGFEPYSVATAESIIIEELEKGKLMKLMASLSTKQKEAIFLRIVKKFSYKEISHSMDLSLSAVKSLINRAKSTLVKLNVAVTEAQE
jgi:RNA polymerase sigma-70 factor, ECF subfamily